MRPISRFVFALCLAALIGCSEGVAFDPDATASSFVSGGENAPGAVRRAPSTLPATPNAPAAVATTTPAPAASPAPSTPTTNAPVAAAPVAHSTPAPTVAAAAPAPTVAAAAPAPAAAPSGPLAPNPAIRCSHRQRITLSNVAIDGGSRGAIEASGECHVTITSCTLASGRVAVSAAGDSQVELVDCTVAGERGAVVTSGTSAVRITGGSVSGSARAAGRSRIEHNGASIAD